MPRKLSKKRVQMNNTKGGAKSYRKIKSRKLKRGGAQPEGGEEGGNSAGGADAEAPPVDGGGGATPPPVVAGIRPPPVGAQRGPRRVEEEEPRAPIEGEGGATLPAGARDQGGGPQAASRSIVDRILRRKSKEQAAIDNLEKAINLIYQVHKDGFPNTLVLIKEAMQAMPGVELEEPTKTQYETLKQKYPGILRDEGEGEEDEDEGGEEGGYF